MWAPILDGALADSALGAVRDIANALAANPRAASATDRTLFWAYTSGVLDEPFADAAYHAAVDDLIGELHAGVPHPALFGGLAGMGWTLAHVLDGDADLVCNQIDQVLVTSLSTPWTESFDLMTGLVGFGVYFLERMRGGSALAHEGLALVIDQLAACADRTDAGAAWFTGLHQLPVVVHERWPNGVHNCGLAHGSPAVIALLSRVPDRSAVRPLADDAVRWLVAQRMSPSDRGRFPTTKEDAPERARAAWCYGDPGIACALHATSPDLALETARDMAARNDDTAGVMDAGLCHGAAGLAHIANRWYQATGDETFAASARTWFARTLDLRRPSGFGGIEAWTPDGMQPEANWLEGAIGVALAMLGAATSVEPAWDRRLLCDLPIRVSA